MAPIEGSNLEAMKVDHTVVLCVWDVSWAMRCRPVAPLYRNPGRIS